jgi:malto-oligosyltrehalose trehalohydrolase/4-alpha-glucanotransferase
MPASPTASDPFAPSPTTPAITPAVADPHDAGSNSWPEDVEPVLLAALPDFLMRQRWYPAKDAGKPVVSRRALQPLAVPGMAAAAGIWRVQPPGREPLHLFVAVALVAEDSADPAQVIARLPGGSPDGKQQVLVEAFSLDAFTRTWVEMMLQDAQAGPGSRLRSGHAMQLAEAGLRPGREWVIRRSRAEQSNTSIRIGDGAIMKVIRKLEEGTHPELEVGRFLTLEAGFEATPAMLAWADLDLTAESGGRESYTLSVMQSFVPNEGDAWDWVLRKLAHGCAGNEAALAEATDWLARLGERTAQMHGAFGTASQDPAFAPEPVCGEDLQSWADAGHAMEKRALDGLAAGADRLDAPARELLAALQADRAKLSQRLDELLRTSSWDFSKTRHHGDYHLGQVLVADGDAVIVDFEGEPMRPLAERRAKHAAPRDVAGLLRSVSYAAAAAARALPPDMPAAQRETAQRRLQAWEREASHRFIEAYLQAARGMAGCPSDRADAQRLIRFFMLEKALYEVAYELANRPSWVDIPLRGILQLLQDDGDPADGGVEQGRVRRGHRMPFGAQVQDDGSVRFRLWAPSHPEVAVELEGESEGESSAAAEGGAPAEAGGVAPAIAPDQTRMLRMQPLEGGWHEVVSRRAHPGTRYRFVLPDGTRVPDPASRFQPQDVHGPSEVIDPTAYEWRDGDWRGRAWEEAVVYELHVGAFTPQGTFRGIIDKLDHLVSLGVTALEIMPVADFPGGRNWGYDGVLPYAPDGAYGRPEDFKALVDSAHARGLMVLLDVVYNHFGPEGAYLHVIAPETFTDRHKTPWGAAINTDGAGATPVREYFIHNALYWIEEFHLDGLRLDAVHAILDDSPKHLLSELAERVRAANPDRQIHLVLENEENQASRLVRDADAKPRWYSAQWNDDVHHVLHVAATGEAHGYYGDYHGDTGKLGRALAEGFAFQGEVMPYRGHERGEDSTSVPPSAFVAFMQNHDQVGNRAFGERLTAIAPPQAVRAMAATYLLLPQVPMLFMGEEWAAAQPFPFFCDFGEELADAVRNGRREEFARFPEFKDPATRERIPDPVAEATFESAKLDWEQAGSGQHAAWLDWYRRVLAARHKQIVPRVGAIRSAGEHRVVGEGAVLVKWALDGGASSLVLAANLSAKPVDGFPQPAGESIWTEGEADATTLGPWAVRWSIEPAPPLDRLALQMGIEPWFRDARGRIVRTSDDTRRRLLAAMGTAAGDDEQVSRALESLQREDWVRPLPPAQVLQPSAGAPALDVVQPRGATQLSWRIDFENGGERSGRGDWSSLELLDRRQVDGRMLERRRLPLPDDLPWGYHRLTLACGSATALVVSPGRCWLPEGASEGRRLWGIAAQLYLLRSASDWGIGDYGDLRSLVELAAREQADVIGLNPLHAMFPDNPAHASPYSPASRLLLNVLNIDVAAIPELAAGGEAARLIEREDFQRSLAACRAQRNVDYPQVSALKMPVLRKLFDACRNADDKARWQQFEAFRRERGELLERNCLFLALREHFARGQPSRPDWREWPQPFRNPDSAEVREFAQAHRREVDFLAWLQWVADEQLESAAQAAARCGMAIGLYRDLAVGADRSGAETWANALAVASDAQVGAPPDIFNPAGQDWGLPPFQPGALRAESYRSFIELIRANMRHAGGLRIDHVMGLQHLYWVPVGQGPADGAYVQYPMDDMIGILALESHRQRCLVVGEDLGTVPEGFRERMTAANILSYRVLFFEQDADGGFLPPEDYPELALAVIGSHDLPTLHGWWQERDLEIKGELGLFPDEKEAASQHEARRRGRRALLDALRAQGLLPAQPDPDLAALSRAAHAFLARTPGLLAMAQLDDLTGETDPVNVPATSDEHPNWRRRHSLTLEELPTNALFNQVVGVLRESRGKASRQAPAARGD